MIVLAFVLLAAMLAAYVMLDGYDLGAGIVDLYVARADGERAAVMESIGPFWNGNEVWLIAAGGTLFALFPQVYASAFSGFYLPFMVVLWLLMFRGIALELRGHFESGLWRGFWDVAFFGASALLTLLFGVALGNVLRGVPLDSAHYFEGTFGSLLNPYALGVGLLAVLALALYGAAYLTTRLDGEPARRAWSVVGHLLPIVVVAAIAMTFATFRVHSPLANVRAMPWIALAPLASLAGIVGAFAAQRRGRALALLRSCALFLAGMVASAAATIFPYLLPGYPDAADGLSAYDAAPSSATLTTTLAVFIVGLLLVAAYSIYAHRRVRARSEADG